MCLKNDDAVKKVLVDVKNIHLLRSSHIIYSIL